jgi:hypothetical protein
VRLLVPGRPASPGSGEDLFEIRAYYRDLEAIDW